ncbi:hypothetical protein [Thiomicrorhabdus sp. Kp2]|uniref:hypothetical protein n=1 Tax=Thiomicrorhabdus sp. Kp2 TaxID=1123518 RepID=UPI0004274852|nr:hypothetical protein [Thiomicrorhabdus sp. Kp2]
MTVEEEKTESWVLGSSVMKDESSTEPKAAENKAVDDKPEVKPATAKKTVQRKPAARKPAAQKTATPKTKKSAAVNKNTEQAHIADQIKVFSSRRVWPD